MIGWHTLRNTAAATAVLMLSLTGVAPESTAQQENTGTGESETVQNRVFSLGEIEVVGKAEEGKNKTVEKVYDEEMRLFDRNFLSDAVNLLPGVTLNRVGARNEMMISVRGLDLKHVPIFQDGIPIYVPYDGYPDLARFTTFDLSEIVVSKGFTSVLYGPNTMGGAINMVSKRPQKLFEMNAGTSFGTGNTISTYGNFGTNQGKWYVQGGGSYVDSDYFRLSGDFNPSPTEDGGHRENSYRTDWKGNVKLGYTPNDTDEYAFSYLNQQGKKGTPPYTGTDPSTSARYWQWPYWDKESFYFNSNTALGDRSYVKTRGYYDLFNNSLFSYDNATYTTMLKKSSFKSWYDDYTAGGSVELGTSLLPRNTLRTAFHYKRDVHREHNEGYPIQRFEDELFSIGVEDTFDITEQFYTIAGISYDSVDTLEAQDLSTTKQLVDFPKSDASALNPQLGLFYKVMEDGLAHASVAGKSRLPSIKDKYSYRLGTAIPNPGLEAEESINYEIGYQHLLFKKVLLEATIFYYDISNFILLKTVPDPSNPSKTVTQNQNIGDVEQYGVEIGASGQLLKNLSAGANYTYLQNENKSSEDELLNTPAHKVFVYLQYWIFKPLSVLASAQYESMRFSSSNAVRVADEFVLVNGKAIWEVAGGFTAEAGVDNIFDEDYALEEGFPEPGRSYFVNMRYRF